MSAPHLKLQPCGFHRLCDISTSCLGTSDTNTGASTPTCSSLLSPSQQMVPPTHLHKPNPGCHTWLAPPLTTFHPGHRQVLSVLCPRFPKSHQCHPLTRTTTVASSPLASLLLPPLPPSPCSNMPRLCHLCPSPMAACWRLSQVSCRGALAHEVVLLRACLPNLPGQL